MSLRFLSESGIEGIDVVVADVNDQDSLEAMCADATVIIDCVGPVSNWCAAMHLSQLLKIIRAHFTLLLVSALW